MAQEVSVIFSQSERTFAWFMGVFGHHGGL